MSGGVWEADNCQKTYEDLKAKGIEFIKPPTKEFYGIEALFKDGCGNWFSLTEHPKGIICKELQSFIGVRSAGIVYQWPLEHRFDLKQSMLEKPNISDELIISRLQEEYKYNSPNGLPPHRRGFRGPQSITSPRTMEQHIS